jgi:excisionase family DNA binding protein
MTSFPKPFNQQAIMRKTPQKIGSKIHPTQGLNDLPILTLRQAAELLQTSIKYVRKQISLGNLRASKLSFKAVRVLRRDLDAFIEAGATKA